MFYDGPPVGQPLKKDIVADQVRPSHYFCATPILVHARPKIYTISAYGSMVLLAPHEEFR